MDGFLDTRLAAIRKEIQKEADEEVVTDAEKSALTELEELGRLLMAAYIASGEQPPAALIDWAEEDVQLPDVSQADLNRLAASIRERIQARLRRDTGALSSGDFVRLAREKASLDQENVAAKLNLPLAAYKQFEAGRMPLWRMPADRFAGLCRQLDIDGILLVRWTSLQIGGGPTGVYGRMDVPEAERSRALGELSSQADERIRHDFEEWRQQFVSAYEIASRGSAQSGR